MSTDARSYFKKKNAVNQLIFVSNILLGLSQEMCVSFFLDLLFQISCHWRRRTIYSNKTCPEYCYTYRYLFNCSMSLFLNYREETDCENNIVGANCSLQVLR